MITRILSGGQTGVDRAALDVAIGPGVPCGGWCPKGRRAEDGPIPRTYPLTETPSEGYEQRTTWNVRDSDGTLVLTRGAPTEGTAYTVRVAERLGKPLLIVDLERPVTRQEVLAWAKTHGVTVLNVAGPRESKAPGIYEEARRFLSALLGPARKKPKPRR